MAAAATQLQSDSWLEIYNNTVVRDSQAAQLNFFVFFCVASFLFSKTLALNTTFCNKTSKHPVNLTCMWRYQEHENYSLLLFRKINQVIVKILLKLSLFSFVGNDLSVQPGSYKQNGNVKSLNVWHDEQKRFKNHHTGCSRMIATREMMSHMQRVRARLAGRSTKRPKWGLDTSQKQFQTFFLLLAEQI